MKRIITVVLALTLTACGGGGGGGGDDTSAASARACSLIGLAEKVIGGETCDNPINSSVVRVVRIDSSGNILGLCSGTLITPTKVLTATHCFGTRGAYAVVAGDQNRSEVAGIKDVSYAPGYSLSDGRIFNDATVAILDRPISSPVMPILLSRSVTVGEPGYVYGYGITEVNGSEASLLELKGGAMTVQNVTPNHIFVEFNGGGVNVCFGDSGGPMVINVNGLPAVAGVVSEGSVEGCAAGDVTTYTNLQSESVLPWLAKAASDAAIR